MHIMNLSIGICDDDKLVLDNEKKLVHDILNEKNINHTIKTFNSSNELLNDEGAYDILFMDIEMKDLNGLQAAAKIRRASSDCLIFFVTNHEIYLDDAFNQHAYRYWIKPLDRHKVTYGIESALKELEDTRSFITVTVSSEKVRIFAKNIIYVYAQDKRMHIITIKGTVTTYDTYKSIYEQLKVCEQFFESHRSYCVNFEYISDYEKDKIFCDYKNKRHEVYLSRRKQDEFRKKLVKWIGEK